MKKLFVLLLVLIAVSPAIAQEDNTSKPGRKEMRRQRINAIARQEEEGVIKYQRHTAFGAKLTSDGYGGFLEIGRAQSISKALLFQLDISERKHPKDEKFQSAPFGVPIQYGKINFFYPVKLGVQQQFLLGNKGNKNGVSISANAGGGLIAGLLRPYVVRVQSGGNDSKPVYYESADSTLFLTGNYTSSPNFGDGWNHLKFTPGVYAKTGLRFDYGKYNEMITAIEVGLSGEFYTKKIPQQVFQEYKQFFFSAYVSIIFGRRK